MVPKAETFGAVFRPASIRGAGWEGVAAGFVRALLWLAVSVLILQVFDRVVPSGRTDGLWPVLAAVVGALALRAGLDIAASAAADAVRFARGRLVVLSAIGDLFTLEGAEAEPPVSLSPISLSPISLSQVPAGPSALSILSSLPVLAAAMVYVSGMMAAPAIFLAAGAALAAKLLHRSPDASKSGGPDHGFAIDILDTLWQVKAMGAENLVLRLAEGVAGRKAADDRARTRSVLSAIRVADLFERLALVFCVLAGTILCLNGLITFGQLAAGALISLVLVRDAYRGTVAWSLSRITSPEAADKPAAAETEPLPRITGNLMVNRVTFEEPAEGLRSVSRQLFDRVRVEVEAGEMVLVTGDDRSMQTALLRLMAGLEEPQAGTVSVDGYDLAHFRSDSIRRQIAYVPSLGDVLPGTLMENLTAFDGGRAPDAMGAARLTGLDAKAARLADGFDTRLSGGAAGFPIGFRQHLAVTRALAFKPKVLLLDHATENLDSQDLRTFSEVLERLKGRVTIVYASSQTGLRALADRTVDLDELTPAPEIGPTLEQDVAAEGSDGSTEGAA